MGIKEVVGIANGAGMLSGRTVGKGAGRLKVDKITIEQLNPSVTSWHFSHFQLPSRLLALARHRLVSNSRLSHSLIAVFSFSLALIFAFLELISGEGLGELRWKRWKTEREMSRKTWKRCPSAEGSGKRDIFVISRVIRKVSTEKLKIELCWTFL